MNDAWGERIWLDGTDFRGRSRLVLYGRVTAADAAELHRAAVAVVAAVDGDGVAVDCCGAEYLDTSVIQLLIALGREVTRGGRAFAVVGASDTVREDFRLTGFAAAG